jgi:general secretion pathway protein D
MSRFASLLLIIASLSFLVITGCTQQQIDDMKSKTERSVQADRDLNYNRDDFRRAMAPRTLDSKNNKQSGSSVPDLAPVIAEEKKNILPQPLVSITVNQDVSLRDIFYELAKQAEVDLELDPTITGSVIFTAYNRPFDQVVERISDMAGLRYTFKNNILRVERDTPYMKTYTLDYLSMVRNFNSSITSNTSASSSVGGAGGGGTNGSTSTISSESQSDFWNELQASISQIINNTNQQVSLTDQSAPLSTPTAIPVVSADQLATLNNPSASAATPPAATGTPVAGLLNPTGTQSVAGATTATDSASTGGISPVSPYFSFNKQAGLLSIFATEKQHRRIYEYLNMLRHSTNAQVLVEAKVFEVELNDENSSGIDWSFLIGEFSGGAGFAPFNFATNPLPAGISSGLVYSGNNFDALITAVSRFGNIRTLSSPRLSVMNNQTAVLNVSESRIFFDIDIQRTEATTTTPERVEITSEAKSVPEGVIIAVHPSIDMDTNEILLNLRPSVTRIVSQISDPAASFLGIGAENLVPELSVRTIDSVVRMRSGETVIMGGLMQDSTNGEQVSTPILGETPIIGPLFRNQRDRIKKTEMVIFLRATVVNSAKPDDTDKDLYKKLSGDRRPFPM